MGIRKKLEPSNLRCGVVLKGRCTNEGRFTSVELPSGPGSVEASIKRPDILVQPDLKKYPSKNFSTCMSGGSIYSGSEVSDKKFKDIGRLDKIPLHNNG